MFLWNWCLYTCEWDHHCAYSVRQLCPTACLWLLAVFITPLRSTAWLIFHVTFSASFKKEEPAGKVQVPWWVVVRRGGAFLYLKLNMDSERREQTRGSPLNWQTHCIFTMFGPAEKKHRQSELTVSTLFLWVLPLGGAPGESGSRQHVASRWANPACLHHFQKSPAVFG